MRTIRRWCLRLALVILSIASCGTLGACNTIAGLGRDLTAVGEGTARRLGVTNTSQSESEETASID